MARDGLRLERELGEALPPGLADLSTAQQDTLADLIESARDRQERALAAAAEEGLMIVPKLLRGSVRKVLFG